MDERVKRILRLECGMDRWRKVRERLDRESRFPCFGYKAKRYAVSVLDRHIEEQSVLLRDLYVALEKI